MKYKVNFNIIKLENGKYSAQVLYKSPNRRLKQKDWDFLEQKMMKLGSSGYLKKKKDGAGFIFAYNPSEKLSNIEIELKEIYRKPGRPPTKQKMKQGGGIINESSDGTTGGAIQGKTHKQGGVDAVVITDNNRPVKLEDKEVIINAESATSNRKYDFEGKQQTAKEILSKINQDGGGVAIMDKGGQINQCDSSMVVQSILFDKKMFSSAQAIEWLRKHNKNYFPDDYEETLNYYRFGQHPKRYFQKDTFRTIEFTDGIKAVVACPKPGREKWMEKGGRITSDTILKIELIFSGNEADRINKLIDFNDLLIDNISFTGNGKYEVTIDYDYINYTKFDKRFFENGLKMDIANILAENNINAKIESVNITNHIENFERGGIIKTESKTTLQELAEKLGGKYWEKGDKKRVYLNDYGYNTKKVKTTTYVEQNDNGDFIVSCYIEAPSQHYNWISSQANEVIESVEEDIIHKTADYYYLLKSKDKGLYFHKDGEDKVPLNDLYSSDFFYTKENAANFIEQRNIDGIVEKISVEDFEKEEKRLNQIEWSNRKEKNFIIGGKYKHKRFGIGEVVDETATNVKIIFPEVGEKVLLKKFIKLEPVATKKKLPTKEHQEKPVKKVQELSPKEKIQSKLKGFKVLLNLAKTDTEKDKISKKIKGFEILLKLKK